MRKPTDSEYALIKERSPTQMGGLSADQLLVLKTGVFDGKKVKDRGLRFSPKVLKKIATDLDTGVPMIIGHDTTKLPLGRSFEGIYQETDPIRTSAKFVLLKNAITEDLAQRVAAGILTDVSGGLSVKSLLCSICDEDLCEVFFCGHLPNMKYPKSKTDKTSVECEYLVDDAVTREVSLVYKGAIESANIDPDFTTEEGVMQFTKDAGRELIMNFSVDDSESKVADQEVVTVARETPAVQLGSGAISFSDQMVPTIATTVTTNVPSTSQWIIPYAELETTTKLKAQISELEKELADAKTNLFSVGLVADELKKFKDEYVAEVDVLLTKTNSIFNSNMFDVKTMTFDKLKELREKLTEDLRSKLPGKQVSTRNASKATANPAANEELYRFDRGGQK